MIRRTIVPVLIAGAAAATPALAQSAFDGTWKTDLSTLQMPQKPDVFAVKNGVYTCESCVPRVEVPADAADHAVTGHPYYDQIAVRVVDDRTIRVAQRLKGKLMFVGESKLGSDGKTLAFSFRDTSSPTGKVVTGHGSEHRVGPAPAGTHAVSGSWKADKMQDVSEAGLVVTFKTAGDTIHMATPTGQSYDARIGGPAVPIQGDNARTMAAVKRISATTLAETDTRDGKVVGVMTMTVRPGTNMMEVTWDDRVQGTVQTYKAHKQ
jgi:hypothetical protein